MLAKRASWKGVVVRKGAEGLCLVDLSIPMKHLGSEAEHMAQLAKLPLCTHTKMRLRLQCPPNAEENENGHP